MLSLIRPWLLSAAALVPAVTLATRVKQAEAQEMLLFSCGMGLIGFALTHVLVPVVMEYTYKAGLFGKDLCKQGTRGADKPIPESLGVVPGVVFLVCIIMCQVVYATTPPRLAEYNAALLSICFMLFLGFADDVLDLRWRYKLVLPTVASLPLLCSYWMEGGGTSVVMPKPVRGWLVSDGQLTWLSQLASVVVTVDPNAHGRIVDLGLLYFVYMGMLAVFCTNAINIYAGINGLEVGQAFVIACAILTMNLTEVLLSGNEEHLFSMVLIIPFIATSLALLKYNWCPASVFVGDTFCYFAGMTFAVVAITGHFSKSLLLFLVPQILNFLLSLPQLTPRWFPLHLPCPRHRLPRVDPHTGLMHPSRIPAELHPRSPVNLTLINIFLCLLGPMSEASLAKALLLFQGVCCAGGFVVRYGLVQFLYDNPW